ncbi:MAG: hypothetical protein ACI8WB_003700 [Phenylobacterium sp.]|jgi:hypothetical protein
MTMTAKDLNSVHNPADLPQWLDEELYDLSHSKKREEIEVKFLLPRTAMADFLSQEGVKSHAIKQYYVPFDIVKQTIAEAPKTAIESIDLPEDAATYDEWRVRQLDEQYLLTGKKKSDDPAKRLEYEVNIPAVLFNQVIKNAGDDCYGVEKIRSNKKILLAGEDAVIELDDYLVVGSGQSRQLASEQLFDFVTCEVEVANLNLAKTLTKGYWFIEELQFLRKGIDITGIKPFSNKQLAKNGFIKPNYLSIKQWVKTNLIEQVNELLTEEAKPAKNNESQINALVRRVTNINDRQSSQKPILDIQAAQDILSDVSFTMTDTLGRKDNNNEELRSLDAMNKGWLRDFHTIVSCDPYLRLSRKPQVFRASSSNTNVTTRGAHTQDVIACSMQLARQLGLNVELCAAIAALHDIGHPAGGHVGEEVLKELSGFPFKHHIFSLSLADIFSLNLLKEVQVGAFYHKTGGGKLRIPKQRPQEYGVVMIADKICYCAWDLFDAINNGYIDESDVPKDLHAVLGKEPLDWLQSFIKAVVLESALMHSIQFTELSGKIFTLYKDIRKLIFEHVHKQIRWDSLYADLKLCYDAISTGFADLDPVPIVAYMTDDEVTQVARMTERLPKTKVPTIEDYDAAGLSFADFIRLLRSDEVSDKDVFYYSQKALKEITQAGVKSKG